MKSFIKNTNSNKFSSSSWPKIIIFTFTSFLILTLISNSHITRACASAIFNQQTNNQQETPILDSKNPNNSNNINNNKDVPNNPKATPNDIVNEGNLSLAFSFYRFTPSCKSSLGLHFFIFLY